MKAIAYIYTILPSVSEKSITPEQAIEMIREFLSL